MRAEHNSTRLRCRCLAILACLCLVLSAAATAAAEAQQKPASSQAPQTMQTWTDDKGRVRKVPWPPRKIVVIGGSRSPLEMICALGKTDMIKSRAEWSMWPPAMAKIPSIGRRPQINMELLLRCKPDFVIANSLFQQNIGHIESVGIPVLIFEPMGLEETPPLIKKMGRLFNCPERARALSAYVSRYLNLLNERLKDLKPEQRPKVFMGRGRQVYYPSFTKGYRGVVEYAGGRNIVNTLSSPYQAVSPEWLMEQNPDYLVIAPSLRGWGFQIPTKKIMQSFWNDVFHQPGVKILPLSKQDHLLLVDGRLCWGLRAFIGALYMAKKFHPSLFGDIDPTEVHRDFLKRFFNLELQGDYVYP